MMKSLVRVRMFIKMKFIHIKFVLQMITEQNQKILYFLILSKISQKKGYSLIGEEHFNP